jgi:hypothetical protein
MLVLASASNQSLISSFMITGCLLLMVTVKTIVGYPSRKILSFICQGLAIFTMLTVILCKIYIIKQYSENIHYNDQKLLESRQYLGFFYDTDGKLRVLKSFLFESLTLVFLLIQAFVCWNYTRQPPEYHDQWQYQLHRSDRILFLALIVTQLALSFSLLSPVSLLNLSKCISYIDQLL